MAMPTRVAACAHWYLRCSVGQTIVTVSTDRSPSSSFAAVSAKVVLPAPGVATARKSLGRSARERVSARRCHWRRGGAGGAGPVAPGPGAGFLRGARVVMTLRAGRGQGLPGVRRRAGRTAGTVRAVLVRAVLVRTGGGRASL